MSDNENLEKSVEEGREDINENFRCGSIGLIGLPNAGKSTLLNSALGQKLSIISSKPQTTRNRILGIYNAENVQIAMVDTPGIHTPKGRLHQIMVRSAQDVIDEVDCICWVVDGEKLLQAMAKGGEIWKGGIAHLADLVSKIPRLSIALNKVDCVNKTKLLPLIQILAQKLPNAEIVPISAKTADNVDALVKVWANMLPNMPPMFPPDQLTDVSERFLVSEIIREKVFILTNQEIPYSVAVQIEAFEEKDAIVEIHARIHVEKDSQKGIIIGKQGSKLKDIGTRARQEIEPWFEKKVLLHLFVSVRTKWTENPRDLKDLGFQ